ncbi:hypothetical protein F4814DRAFT_453152 [Daldinia grandis]|nr:hypothetical protein F4814DRAFT_453152 [Daldinia grandis]
MSYGTTYLEAAVELFWRWKKENRQLTNNEAVYLRDVCRLRLTNAFRRATRAVLAKPAPGHFYHEEFSSWYQVIANEPASKGERKGAVQLLHQCLEEPGASAGGQPAIGPIDAVSSKLL